MLSLLRLRSGRRRILSECQSQDSQHLNSSSIRIIISIPLSSWAVRQTRQLLGRSLTSLFVTPPQQSHSSGSLSLHSSPPSSLSARVAPLTLAEHGGREGHRFAPRVRTQIQSRGKPGPPLPLPPRPLTCSVSALTLALSIYMASSVPVPSRDESSPLPEPPRADEAVCNSPLALESSPAPPLEAIDPARLFVNREGGSPPRPRLQGMRTWLFTRGAGYGCQRGGSGTKSR